MHFLLLHHVTSLSAAASTSRASTDCCRGLMSTCVAEIERSKKDTLKIICDGKSFFSASQNCSWQAYLVCHGGDMWAANGKRSKTSKTASFFSFWVNSRRSFTDGQSSKRMVNCIMSAVEVVKAPSACYSECPSKSAKIMV